MRSRILAAQLAALAAFAVFAASAGAIVVDTPSGRLSYLPVERGTAPQQAGPFGATEPNGEPPLLYHGGPIMHSHAAYAIFWVPSGYSLPSGYQTAIESYFENVAADSGKPTNVYSVSAQYFEEPGHVHASYADSYGGSTTDETAYPTSGTCAPYTAAESFTACISDAKLEAEVEAVVAAKSWPTDLSAEYYVVLPPHAGSCFEAAGNHCFDKQFCAYHSYSLATEEIYANISYSPGDVAGCGVGEYPNGHSNGNVDDTLSSLSHEANESITDPLISAWFDAQGEENGDECRNTNDDFGLPLGGAVGSLFNQSINGAHYYLQQEWSNDVEDCGQRVEPATPVIADPEEVAPGESVPFDGTGSVPGSGGIVSYAWNFGDLGTATGPSPSHTYASPGLYTVTLTVKDDGGFSYSTTREVTVSATPQLQLSVSVGGTGSGTVTGTGISCPGTCSHKYATGESVTLTATPSASSTFSGWSGGGCSGTGTCNVTMSVKQAVTATFTALPAEEGPASPGSTPAPVPAPAPTPIVHKKVLKCRKGFRKARRHGKTVCVKIKRNHRKHR
jgi:PKD domain/Divergent InlB B-repeat domain